MTYSSNRERVLEIYGYQCANHPNCREYGANGGDPITIHHIIFRSDLSNGMEGAYNDPNEPANLCPLCFACHKVLHQMVQELE